MLAMIQIIEPLKSPTFRIWRQTRTGLLSYPLDATAARAHLATSVYLQMALKPHIIHVVGHTEAHHAAAALDVIEACGLARRAIENALGGMPDMTADPTVLDRTRELLSEAQITLQAVYEIAGNPMIDPYTDPPSLARAVQLGILDAPHLRNNRYGLGKIRTQVINGKCLTVNSDGMPITEMERLAAIL